MAKSVNYFKMIGNLILYFGSFYLIATQSFRLINLGSKGFRDFIWQNSFIYIALGCLLGFLVYLVIFHFKKQNLFQFCGFRPMPFKSTLMVVMIGVAMVAFSVFFVKLSFVVKNFPEFEQYMAGMDPGPAWLIALCLLVIPAFEEIMLRGLLFNELRKYLPVLVAFMIQLLIYALMQGNLPVAVYAVMGGTFYTLAYLWTNSLWAAILIQIISALGLFAARRTGIGKSIAALPEVSMVVVIIASILVIALCMIYLWSQRGKSVKSQGLNVAG